MVVGSSSGAVNQYSSTVQSTTRSGIAVLYIVHSTRVHNTQCIGILRTTGGSIEVLHCTRTVVPQKFL